MLIQKSFLTLFFLTSVVPFSGPAATVVFEFSLSSTLKLTLDVFLRPSLCVGAESVVMVAGAIVIGGVQSELKRMSASL